MPDWIQGWIRNLIPDGIQDWIQDWIRDWIPDGIQDWLTFMLSTPSFTRSSLAWTPKAIRTTIIYMVVMASGPPKL